MAADVDSMLKVMRHRGPDGSGQWRSPDGRYHCGFTRLAIVDLSTGDQPILAADGRRVLVGNGEIYNYLELRQHPACRDYPWRTQGDMEPVLPLADAFGSDFVDHLNGMYGLALYDGASHALTLVRDRLGIKPLYWTRLDDGTVVFASEVKGLFASGLVVPEVEEAGVAAYLAHNWVPAPATLWRGVRKLAPGHMLTIDADGTIAERCYWRPHPAATVPGDFDQAVEEMTALLDDSVRLQLRADVPLGALLSGGLDSGLVVALAARRLDRPLNTYTVRFEGAAYDETPLAAQVARRYGTHHQVFTLTMAEVADHLPMLAWYCDEPLADASLLPNQMISQVLGHEVRVVLNGTGGDELFAGYGRYFQLPVEARYLELPRALRRGAIEPLMRWVSPMQAWRLSRGEKFVTDGGGYLHDHCTLFPPPILDLIGCGLPRPPPAQAAVFAAYGGDSQSAALAADLSTYLPEDLLLLLDRSTMAASVEGRVPFLDHRLVEAALAVPAGIRTRGGRQKALERAMAARLLPADVLEAPKRGFASPAAMWMRGELGNLARAILTSETALRRGWWTRQGIDRLAAAPGRHAHRLYALLMLELTIRLHGEQRHQAPPSLGLRDLAA
ncbi:asparagine synthase (glutamine-hydrolyzing) [Magnetospirillum gryphiswaldense]|uniref:asparagine synthase (glutamine-hydrolyzing) n=1 Tax=Magnetospirillum gryphiswaldense TaxID=55518 RepID=UPI001F2B3508|nr:asparagine synthase (glutamine-hydrolyzing) [Magnetospirillum gryphiswaldense]